MSAPAHAPSPPRILLFGAGSIGAIYVHFLTTAHASVTAVCRSNLAAVRASGFHITSPTFGTVTVHPTSAVASPADAPHDPAAPWDFIVVTSKAFPGASPSTPELLAPAVGPKTTIVLIQNGIAIEDEYKQRFPDNPLLSCVVYLPTTQVAPARIEMRERDRLEIGTYPTPSSTTTTTEASKAATDAAHAFAALLTAGGATAEVVPDIQPRRWRKLLLNASWNPICALARAGDAEFLSSGPGAEALIAGVMREVVAVAGACGYGDDVTEGIAEEQLGRAKGRAVGVQPSMMADALGGRRMEVEAIVGNTVRLGRERGVAMPLLEVLYVLVRALDGVGVK